MDKVLLLGVALAYEEEAAGRAFFKVDFSNGNVAADEAEDDPSPCWPDWVGVTTVTDLVVVVAVVVPAVAVVAPVEFEFGAATKATPSLAHKQRPMR
jgi:hypothetical protein